MANNDINKGRKHKNLKNLLIIGNGADLSLGLHSSFFNYITFKGCHDKSKLNQIKDFIYKFNRYAHDLSEKLNKLGPNIHLILKDKKDVNNYSNPIFLDSRRWASNYFVIKSVYKDYCLGLASFKDVKDSKEYKSLTDGIHRFNNVSNRMFNNLKVISQEISNINFWDLLIIIQGCFAQRYYDIVNFSNWYDIENMIKYYIISVINYPKHINQQDYKLNKNHYFFNKLNNYISEDTSSSAYCFNFYTCINRYLDLLQYIIREYEWSTDKHDISNDYIEKHSALAFNNSKDRRCYSFNLYNFILVSYTDNYKSLLISNVKSNINNFFSSYICPLLFLVINVLGYKPQNNDNENNYLFRFLHEQLKYFESDFCLYLKENIVNKNKYLRSSYNLYKKLTSNSDFMVIDFNYTPLDKHVDLDEHVHGSLKNRNIIIGIGETEINHLWDRNNDSNDHFHITRHTWNQLFSFTKTYRLLEKSRTDKYNKHDKHNDKKHHLTDKSFDDIKNIVVFGHSLGINDYPYFKALFDRIKLYNSNVSLTFDYCKHYPNDDIDKRMHQQLSKVINLLRIYGSTFNNKSHGESLMTQMLIEHRLKINDVSNFFNLNSYGNNVTKKDSHKYWNISGITDINDVIIYIESKINVNVRDDKVRLKEIFYTKSCWFTNYKIPNYLLNNLDEWYVSVGEKIVPKVISMNRLNYLSLRINEINNIDSNYGNSEFILEFIDSYGNKEYVSITQRNVLNKRIYQEDIHNDYKTSRWYIEYIGPIAPNPIFFIKRKY